MSGNKRALSPSACNDVFAKKARVDLKKDYKSINLETDKEWILEKHGFNNLQNTGRLVYFPTWHFAHGKQVGLAYSCVQGQIHVIFRQYSKIDKQQNTTVKLSLDEWELLQVELPKLQKVIAAVEGKKKKKTPEGLFGVNTIKENEKGWKKHQYNLNKDLVISIDWNSESAIVRLKKGYDSVMLSACGFSYFKEFIAERIDSAIKMWQRMKDSTDWSSVLL